MDVPDIPVWIRDLPVIETPFVLMLPAIPNAAAVVVACHLQRVLPNGTRNHDIVDLPGGIVIQDIVRASRRSDTLENTRHADRVVIVANEQSRAS
jgi:hypothetical protein